MNQAEINRLQGVLDRSGEEEMMDFTRRTYKTYRRALLTSRRRGRTIEDSEGEPSYLMRVQYEHLLNGTPKNVHHASIPEFRRGFIESCIVFRAVMQGKLKLPVDIQPQV